VRRRFAIRVARYATFLGTLLGAGGGCATHDASAEDTAAAAAAVPDEGFRPLAPGDTAPAYAAVTLAGDSVRLGAGAGAQPLTLLNLWATWCTSCREEFADLEALQRALGPRGLRVLAVSVDRGGTDKVARFVRAQGTTFAVAHDPAGAVRDRYRAVGVPESYLIAPNGTVLWRHAGGLHGAPEAARAAVERALKGDS
jgi:cytochrome c biogenesis protein CcmG, thiol:disulfide interchange protein DsbE